MLTSFLAFVRHGLTTLGGGLVASGFMSADDLQAAVGSLVTLIGLGLSLWDKRRRVDREAS